MSYFSMSKTDLAACAASGDMQARQELARRRTKNNPDVVDASAGKKKTGAEFWAGRKAAEAQKKAERRAKWSPAKVERMKIVRRVMNFAQHLIRENGWYPGTALKVAWKAEQSGQLSDYTLRAKREVPADVLERLTAQAADPSFRQKGEALRENPRGRGKRSRVADDDFDYGYGL